MATLNFSLSHPDAIAAAEVSNGDLSEIHAVDLSGIVSGRRADLDGMRRKTPDRWMAFLHAHFRDTVSVAYFFGVDEKTARNWWNGKNEPRLSAFAAMMHELPVNARLVIVNFLSEAA